MAKREDRNILEKPWYEESPVPSSKAMRGTQGVHGLAAIQISPAVSDRGAVSEERHLDTN